MSKAYGTCKFCERIGDLERSHLLPAAAHRATKDRGRNVLSYLRQGIFKEQNQTDFTEPLLCFACEQRFSVFENIAIRSCHTAWKSHRLRRHNIEPQSILALSEFAYSVFWRASISNTFNDYSLGCDIENHLRNALFAGEFPQDLALPISMSFLEVTGVNIPNRILMTPWIINLIGGVKITYFALLGMVFRMHYPSALHEVEEQEFLRPSKATGQIHPLKSWEIESIDDMFTKAYQNSKRSTPRHVKTK
jgi:hypothetical protein